MFKEMMLQFQQRCFNNSTRWHSSYGEEGGFAADLSPFQHTAAQRLINPSGRTNSGFLSDLASDNGALFLGITETWCHSGAFDEELLTNFTGYSVLRSDCNWRDGGFLCLFLQDGLTGEHDNLQNPTLWHHFVREVDKPSHDASINDLICI